MSSASEMLEGALDAMESTADSEFDTRLAGTAGFVVDGTRQERGQCGLAAGQPLRRGGRGVERCRRCPRAATALIFANNQAAFLRPNSGPPTLVTSSATSDDDELEHLVPARVNSLGPLFARRTGCRVDREQEQAQRGPGRSRPCVLQTSSAADAARRQRRVAATFGLVDALSGSGD